MINQVVEQNLNVRQTEELVQKVLERQRAAKPPQERKRTFILKDLRLFRNSIKSLTDTLKSSGLEVEVEERDGEDSFELLVIVKKPEGVREDG